MKNFNQENTCIVPKHWTRQAAEEATNHQHSHIQAEVEVLRQEDDVKSLGIGAVVPNGAKIGRNCLVGAGALVTEGKEFPDGSMIIGSPAKAVRQLTPEQMEGLRWSARHYVANARRFQAGLRKID